MSSTNGSTPAGYPVFTKRWHNKPYSTISSTRPENSARGKVIAVTGGGTGIGAAVAKSFAEAGAAGIGLVGRREEQLKSSSKSISSASNTTKVDYATADVTDKDSLDKAFSQFAKNLGSIDVLVSNAGYFSKADLSSADGDDWWRSFEVDVKGSFNTVQAFIPHAKPDAAVLSVNAALAHTQPALPRISSYITSKLASARLHECLQVEHPELRVVSVHPGIAESAMTERFGASGKDDRKALSPDLRGILMTISSRACSWLTGLALESRS